MVKKIEPGPGQESVWDYPRPPKIEVSGKLVKVMFGGKWIAQTDRALRVLETSHPPVYYIPAADVLQEHLQPTDRKSFCEFKGRANYYHVSVNDKMEPFAAWSYPRPVPGYEGMAGYFAFYPSKMDRCEVDGETVEAQDGDFYGGWITKEIVGPFKGAPDTWHW